MRWNALSLVGMLSLTSCGFVHDETLVARYHLVGVDARNEMMVCWTFDSGDCDGLAGPTVYAAGFNDKFVVAAVHPDGARTAAKVFVIIWREPEREAEENGEPRRIETVATEAEYAAAKARLRLPEFSVAFDDLK